MPDALQWPVIAAMLVLGLAMLQAGLSAAGACLAPRRG
ncbi:hypothetical protein BDZ31_000105 [Conexibacter arvalis]|uniref:Uncharacterized protein n=1 Tax=Conexibacter arvalis TaxID=912552 RepID=A0A840I7N9_9ACTN|nr:hypothetical protein [Conexibacter arvalis]